MPFAIGIENVKSGVNVGSLLRSAYNFGASLVFTVGRRYSAEITDTPQAWRHIPVLSFDSWEQYRQHAVRDWTPVAIELMPNADNLRTFVHPDRAVYFLGPEDGRVSNVALRMCKHVVQIPTVSCINVATAGAIVMYDRAVKEEK